ncbi:MAG: hypothetical protein ACHP84_15625 [Caulobacterales bacterium]
MGRALGCYERAAVLTDGRAPFHAAIAATFDMELDPDEVRRALSQTVRRAPLASMYPVDGRFEPCGVAEPEFIVMDGDGATLDAEVDVLLSDRPRQRGVHPVRARLIRSPTTTSLLIAAPHYLVDAISLGNLLFGALGDGDEVASGAAQTPPAVEDLFPAAYRGLRAAPRIAAFVASQVADDAHVRLNRIGAGPPRAPPPGRSRHVVRDLDADFALRLGAAMRRRECTLNGLLAAVAARVFATRFLQRADGPVTVMGFRDLRQRVEPPIAADAIGVNFSMVRHVIELSGENIWDSAAQASRTLAVSGRRGDAFVANLIAPQMVAAAFAMGMRFADVAVSAPLLKWPRATFVQDLRRFSGFVSAMPLAPPLSIIAAQSPAGLSLSFMYVDSEFDAQTAAAMADEVIGRLAAALNGAQS